MFPAGQVIVGRLPSSYPVYEHTHADIAISVTFDMHLELLSSPRLEHGSMLLGQILTAKEREEGGAAGDYQLVQACEASRQCRPVINSISSRVQPVRTITSNVRNPPCLNLECPRSSRYSVRRDAPLGTWKSLVSRTRSTA